MGMMIVTIVRMKRVLVYSLLLIAVHFQLQARERAEGENDNDTKLSKTVTRSFYIADDGHVSITNKYGPIVIDTWDEDSVSLKIQITVWGKNDKNVDKLMARVDFDFDQKGKYLTLKTVLDRGSGFFTELWNNIGDYSKTLLSQNKLKIEYTVLLPSTVGLDITNKFGDVYFQDYRGKLEVNLSHGNIRANNLYNYFDLDLSFGTASIKNISNGNLVLKATESDFDEIGTCTIESSSSEIIISMVDNLRMDSRSDRKFIVRNAKDISGTANFSKIVIESFQDDLRLSLSYGEIHIGKLRPGFSSLDLEGKTTEITLEFEEDNYLDFEYNGKEDKIIIPLDQGKLEKKYIDDKDNLIALKGFLGNKGNKGNKSTIPGKVSVSTRNGEVLLIFD